MFFLCFRYFINENCLMPDFVDASQRHGVTLELYPRKSVQGISEDWWQSGSKFKVLSLRCHLPC